MNLFERIYRSCHQLPYDDASADSLIEHIILCFKDPECLREMANASKKSCDLPANIWLDCGRSYQKSGHWKRIKFQKDHGSKINHRNLASMDLNGYPIEKTMSGCKLSSKEVQMISNFVVNNASLIDLTCGEYIAITDFFDIMIPGGEIASEEEKKEQRKLISELL